MTAEALAPDVGDDVAEGEDLFSARGLRRLGGYALLGVIILLVNFPKFLGKLIDFNVQGDGLRATLHAPISAMQSVLAIVIGPSPIGFFGRAMAASFILLWVFLVALAALSIRRRSVPTFACGIGGILAGYFGLHLIAWAAVAVVATVYGVLFVAHWIGVAIAAIIAFVFKQFGTLLLVGATVAAVALAYRLRRALLSALERLWQVIQRHRTMLMIVAAALALAAWLAPLLYRYVLKPLWRFLTFLLSPIVHVFLFLIKWIIIVVVVVLLIAAVVSVALVSLALLGSLLITQLQASWYAARSARHALIAGFAIGSGIALVVLESLATPALADSLNHAWLSSLGVVHLVAQNASFHLITDLFRVFLPGEVKQFVFLHLTNLRAPAFDSLVLCAVMGLAASSEFMALFMRAPVVEKDVSVRFVVEEYAKMSFALFIVLGMVFAAAMSGDSQA